MKMIEKIINLLANIPSDKLLHSYLSLIIVLIIFDICEKFCNMWISILISCGITIIFMALKEIYDSKNKDYYKFNHWSESVVAYKEWIQKKYQPPNDYYIFLKKINYAEKEDYTRLLKKIVKSRKNDKR